MRRIPQLGACVPDSPGADGARRTRRPGGNAADAAEETQCGGRGAGMNGASIQRGAADTADGRQCGGCSGREAMRRTMHTPAAARSRCVATQRRQRASAAQTGRPANERADGWTNRRVCGHAGIIIDLRAGGPAGRDAADAAGRAGVTIPVCRPAASHRVRCGSGSGGRCGRQSPPRRRRP